jgi:hypothetical protein
MMQVEMTGSSVFDYIHHQDHSEMAEQLGLGLAQGQNLASPGSGSEESASTAGTNNPDGKKDLIGPKGVDTVRAEFDRSLWWLKSMQSYDSDRKWWLSMQRLPHVRGQLLFCSDVMCHAQECCGSLCIPLDFIQLLDWTQSNIQQILRYYRQLVDYFAKLSTNISRLILFGFLCSIDDHVYHIEPPIQGLR